MRYILGIDVGTTALKVGIFDENGIPAALNRVKYNISYPESGWAEISPHEWWNALIICISDIWKEAGIAGSDIVAIGISSLCPAVVPMDVSGFVLRPAIPYFDQRSINQVAKVYAQVSPDTINRITGNRIAAGAFSVSSALWIKDHEPDIYETTAILGHVNTFIAHRLTGEFGTDYTNASFSGLFDIVKQDWSCELCDIMGISKEKLPPILPSNGVIGNVTPEASRATGLKEDTIVAIGAADTACSALALGVTGNGQVFESCGATEVLTISWDHPCFDSRFLNRCHIIPGKYLSHGAMSTTGSAVEWFKSVAYPGDGYEGGGYDGMMLEAQDSPPGAKGLVFLPYLMGERTPVWNPYARGVFWGLSLSTTRMDMSRSILEGAAFGLAQILEIVEQDMGLRVDRILSVGGGARNVLWNQIKADITGKVFLVAHIEDTALLGASIIAAVASGIFRDYKDAVAHMSHIRFDAFHPREDTRQVYDVNYQIYKKLSSSQNGKDQPSRYGGRFHPMI